MKKASNKMALSRTTSSLLSLTLFALCFLQVNSFTFIEATTGDDLSQLIATLASLQDCQIAVEDLQALLRDPPTTPATTTTETTIPTTTTTTTIPTTTTETTIPTTTTTTTIPTTTTTTTIPTTTTTTTTPTTTTTTTNPTTTTTTPTTTTVDPSGPPDKREDVNIIAISEMDYDQFLSNDDITSEGWFGETRNLSHRWETQVGTTLENMNAIVYNISIDPLTDSTALDGEILKLNILVTLGNDIPGLVWNSNRDALLIASSETLVLVNESITVVQNAIDVAGTTTEPPTTTTTTEAPPTTITTTEAPITTTTTELPATNTSTELPVTITATELPATNPTTEQSGTNSTTDPPATNTTTEQSIENSTTDLPCDNCGNGGSPTLVIWLVSVLLLCVVVALVLVFWKPWKRHGTKKDLTERHGSVGVFNSGYSEEPKPSTSTMTIPRPVVIPMSDRSQRSGPSLNRYQPSISEPSPLPRSYKSYT